MFVLLISIITSLASASEVKIDSFYYVGAGTRVAEVCGHVVDGKKVIEPVIVTVDPDTNKSADYVFHATSQGKFCSLVVTYSGTAKAVTATGISSEIVLVKSADHDRE